MHQLIKKNLFNSFYILLILSTTSCIERGTNTGETRNNEPIGQNGQKVVSEIIFVDNGAVVPQPSIRQLPSVTSCKTKHLKSSIKKTEYRN